MDLVNEELLLLAQNFDAFKVKYLLVVGFAVNFYRYKRTTGDVDIYLKDSLKNRQTLIEALKKMKYNCFDMLLTVLNYSRLLRNINGLRNVRRTND